jgi:anti-sigma factor RsiW
MLRCYRIRRRLGAYLDGALDERESALAAAHLATCARCHAELDELRQLSRVLRLGASPPAVPAWTGLWEGIRRGIEESRGEIPSRARPGRRPRLVAGVAAALATAAAVILWQVSHVPKTRPPDAAISVSSADTDDRDRTVMVYTPPERDLAVVWVFDRD